MPIIAARNHNNTNNRVADNSLCSLNNKWRTRLRMRIQTSYKQIHSYTSMWLLFVNYSFMEINGEVRNHTNTKASLPFRSCQCQRHSQVSGPTHPTIVSLTVSINSRAWPSDHVLSHVIWHGGGRIVCPQTRAFSLAASSSSSQIRELWEFTWAQNGWMTCPVCM